MTRFVDLSHVTVADGQPEPPGRLPATRLHSARLRYPGAPDASQVPLHTLARVPGVLVHVPATPRRAIDVLLPPGTVRGRALLVRTGCAGRRRLGGVPDEGGPYLSRRAAETLIDSEATLLGVDFGMHEQRREASSVLTLLLGCEIPVVDHLRGLDRLPATGFWFSAVPLATAGAPTLPVRAFAEVPDP